MGFFAAELATVLTDAHQTYDALRRVDIGQAHIAALQAAALDTTLISTLPRETIARLVREFSLSPLQASRLYAGFEADQFLRLVRYHNYGLEESMNKANAVFAASLKDRMMQGGGSEIRYLGMPTASALPPPTPKRRGRAKVWRKEQQGVIVGTNHE